MCIAQNLRRGYYAIGNPMNMTSDKYGKRGGCEHPPRTLFLQRAQREKQAMPVSKPRLRRTFGTGVSTYGLGSSFDCAQGETEKGSIAGMLPYYIVRRGRRGRLPPTRVS
jgi:hypothetical protein